MPQRLLLEGPDIDELLLRVQNEHGPNARIVHAEQKLVGGVAGFFARRRYELSVQVDDEAAPPAASVQSVAAPRSFEELLTDADGADGTQTHPSAATSTQAPSTQALSTRTADATTDVRVPTQRGRRLSTQTPQFENLLSSLLDRVERGTEEPPANPLPSRRSDDSAPDLAAALELTTGDSRTTAWDQVLIGRADRKADASHDPHPAMAGPSAASAVPTSGGATRAALQRLGLPADRMPDPMTNDPATNDPRAALLDLLGRLAQPASGRLWGTTVVVGPADLAHRAVEAIVAHTGGTGAEPLLATSSTPSAADLAVRASALCTTHGAAVVVIETPATRSAARRAGRLVAGLGLGTVVAAVDATRDVGATREWLAELGAAGRHVDQLAAFDVAESPTPLALLGLGPDVGWLDGRAATVGTWAAPCLDRLLESGSADG